MNNLATTLTQVGDSVLALSAVQFGVDATHHSGDEDLLETMAAAARLIRAARPSWWMLPPRSSTVLKACRLPIA